MAPKTMRAWRVVHTWSSLVCTVFLLMLCVTGLPLIFREEVDGLLKREPPYPSASADAHASLDRVAAAARAAYPSHHIRTIFTDDGSPQVGVVMTPQPDGDFKNFHRLYFDARTGDLRTDELKDRPGVDVTAFLLTLHANLFAGLPGEIFLGVMAVVFIVSLASGAVLYAPFMRKLDFGEVRRGGSGRLAWLDLHNFLGVAALAWMAVVGATGVMNAFATPLFGVWQLTEVAPILKPYAGKPIASSLASYDKAVADARARAPGMTFDYLSTPGRAFSSPAHYVVWLKGDRTLTSRMLTPVLVNATTGRVEVKARMPWYLRALEVSRPLHFGDYGGPLLKLLWGVLDTFAIVVLGSGVYLWVAKRRWSVRSRDLLSAEADAVGSAA